MAKEHKTLSKSTITPDFDPKTKAVSDYWDKSGAPKGLDHWPLPDHYHKHLSGEVKPKGDLVLPDHFTCLSAQKTGGEHNEEAHRQLKQDIIAHGLKPVETHGKYDTEEKGYMVPHDGSEENKKKLEALGNKYNQTSVLHSSYLTNHFVFGDGRKSEPGVGVSHGGHYDNHFTLLPSGHKFQLAVNPEPLERSDDRHPHYYGTMKGVHVFHATHEDHVHMIGKHLHSPTNAELNEAIDEANKHKTKMVYVHGTPPEAMRVTLQQLKPTNDIKKHTYGSGNDSFHGWISPDGKFNRLKPNEYHEDWIANKEGDEFEALKRGYIKVGSAGGNEVAAAESVLNNPKHPANKTLRNMIKDSIYDPHTSFMVHHDGWESGDDFSNVSADTEHFIKHGKVKEFMGKSIKMDEKEFTNEHKRLINVLESPSHKDDLVEAGKQRKELGVKIKDLKNRLSEHIDYSDLNEELESLKNHALESLKSGKIKQLPQFNEIKKSAQVSISSRDLAKSMDEEQGDCQDCGSGEIFCDCYTGLPKPQMKFDSVKKSLKLSFDKKWDDESREAFIIDIKRKAAQIIKKR
jgi:hypothetical protein